MAGEKPIEDAADAAELVDEDVADVVGGIAYEQDGAPRPDVPI